MMVSGPSNSSYAKAAADAKKNFENFKKSASSAFSSSTQRSQLIFNNSRTSFTRKTGESAADMRKRFNDEFAQTLGNEQNWAQAEALPAQQAPVTGPAEGENPQYDAIVKGQSQGATSGSNPTPAQNNNGSSTPMQSQSAPVTNHPPVYYNGDSSGKGQVQAQQSQSVPVTNHPPVYADNGVPQAQQPQSTPTTAPVPQNPTTAPASQNKTQIHRPGVFGSYSIVPSNNSAGFEIQGNLAVTRNNEAHKFFDTYSNSFLTSMRQDSKWCYFRGLKNTTQYGLEHFSIPQAEQRTARNNAIYNDLLAKQKNGTTLSDAEQKFMKNHLANLDKMHLAVDANGNLIEKSD